MNWGTIFGVSILTGIIAAVSAGVLTYLCIDWYSLARNDGGDLGYYIIFLPAGLLVGCAIGAVVARNVPGFLPAQGLSLLLILAPSLVGGVVARMYGEVAPTIDGSLLVLQIELKYPQGWQPDDAARDVAGRFCWLQPVGPGHRMAPTTQGDVEWKQAAEVEGRWVVPCTIRLSSSRETRLVNVSLGKTWVGFYLQLPAHPTARDKEWSPWISEKFSYQAGQSPVTDHAYRCRVQRVDDIRDAVASAAEAYYEARNNAARASPADAPIAQWLPLFEDADGGPAAYGWGGAERIERQAVSARILDLAPLLTSSDPTVMRQAVFALGSLQTTPEPLVAPLVAAGQRTVDLIKIAQAANPPDADADKRALQYFDMWRNAMNNAGPAAAPRFRIVLEDIERQARASTTGDIEIVARETREYLEKLNASRGPQ